MYKKKLYTQIAMLSVATGWTAMSGVAMAQDDSSDGVNAVALEEVIVTARKRSESLQDVPVAVTALTDELQQSTLRTLQDIQGYVPNVVIDKVSASQGGASISIRGISYQEIDKSLDPPIGVILDGVYLGTNAGQILNNFDIERMEVLRGPQGTLFGKNTIGGAINVIRSAPTKDWGVKAKVAGGSWDKRDIQALVNTPLTENGGLKLYYSSLQHDGYIENDVYGDDVGDQDYTNYGATLAFDLTDTFDIALTVETTEDKSEVGAWANFNKLTDLTCLTTLGADIPGIPNSPAPFGSGCMDFDPNSDEDHSSQNEPNRADVTSDFVNLTMNWMLGDWRLTSITGYIDRDEATRLEYDASANEFLYVLTDVQYEQTSQEFRINGDLGNINLTGGLYYWNSEYHQSQDSFDMWYYFGFNEAMGLAPGQISQNLTGNGDNTAYAVFASMDWALTDRLLLNLGGRFTWEEKNFTGGRGSYDDVFSGQPFIPAGPVQDFEEDWTEFSPRVALQYDLSDDMMVFGSYSNGFKSGGFFARTQDIENLNSYDPEYVDTFELGIKSEWWDNRVRFNATAFYTEYSDKQEDVIVANPSGEVGTIVANASDAEIMGLEFEVTAAITSKLRVFMQAGFLDTEYSDFNADINGDGMVTDNSDLIIRNAPEKTFGIGANYIQPLSFGDLAANYTYGWRDEYQSIFSNDPLGVVDAAGFHNASLDVNFLDHYRLSFYGRNLSDERYARPVLITPVSSFGQYNEPRNYGVELTVVF